MTDTIRRVIFGRLMVAGIGIAIVATTAAEAQEPFRLVPPGELAVWGTDTLAMQGPPAGDFVALAAGGALQSLVIRNDRTMFLSGTASDFVPPVPPQFADLRVSAVGMGRNHALAIRAGDGAIVTWGLEAAGAPPSGRYIAVTGGGLHNAALDSDGHVIVWGSPALRADYGAVVGVGAPAGVRFKAIAARARYTLALSADGNIYGWGIDRGIFNTWKPDQLGHFIAPAQEGNPYTAIAAGLGGTVGFNLIVALRQDGSVVVWDPSDLMSDAPAGVKFTDIAAGLSYAVGIDDAGELHGWGDAMHTGFTAVPPGVYSALSAATGHVTVIAAPPGLYHRPVR